MATPLLYGIGGRGHEKRHFSGAYLFPIAVQNRGLQRVVPGRQGPMLHPYKAAPAKCLQFLDRALERHVLGDLVHHHAFLILDQIERREMHLILALSFLLNEGDAG
jgi:hypothetical protein